MKKMISITKVLIEALKVALLALSGSPPIQLLLVLQEWYPIIEMIVLVLWVVVPQILLETIDWLTLSNKPLYHRKLLFWRYTAISVGSEDLAADSPTFNSLPTSMQTIWTPFEAGNPLSGFGSHPSGDMKTQSRGNLPPTFPESIEHPFAWRIRSDPPGTSNYVGLVPI